MRLLILFILISSLTTSAQNTPHGLEARVSGAPTGAFVLTLKENAAGQPIIRRLEDGYVIIRNHQNARKENAVYFEINNEWKWAENYSNKQSGRFYLQVDENPFGYFSKIKLIAFDPDRHMAEIEGNVRLLRKEVLALPTVTFIQKKSDAPRAESRVREHNLGLNGFRKIHSSLPSLTGSIITASVKEGAFDPLDMDIKERATIDELSASTPTNHATDMATLIGGAGNSFINGRGVAERVMLYSENFANLFPASNTAFTARNITVQNHSYGVGIENYYGLESVAYDNQALQLGSLLHIYSAGNSGTGTGTGTYSGLTRYGTITGSFKQAKNVLLVTSTNHTGDVLAANSAGPAYDGRIKPELSAFGNGGTSDAAALVSGSASLIQERWTDLNGELPNTDMLKAILIAGLDDTDAPGPDFFGGYGLLNLRKSIEITTNDWWFEGTVSDGQTITHQIEITEPTDHLTVVLAWRDPAANNGDALALVHDLDLAVSINAEEWQPWVLNASPNVTDLATPATTGIDRLNNVEVIRIDNPSIGTFDVAVHGFDVSADQTYSVAYFMEPTEHFVWKYPTNIDPQEAGEETIGYFDHTFDISGTLEWGDLTDTWTTIGTINPRDRHYAFTLPDINSEVKLRATFGGTAFESEIFRIAPKPEIKVALLCDDELVVNWSPVQVGATYEVLYVANGLLNVLQTSADTFAIVNRNEINSLNFTVRQLGELADGLPDETIRVDFQAIGCYLNNFLVSVGLFGTVNMQVDLSLPERVETLRILKVDLKDSTVYAEITPTNTTHFFSDADLVPGRSRYYAQLVTATGLEILSEPFELFATDDKTYILFPNPVTDGYINFLSPVQNAIFQVLQLDGRLLFDYILTTEFESIPVELSKGTYVYRVIKNGEVLKSGKFAVGS